MKKKKLLKLLFLMIIILALSVSSIYAKNVLVEDFEKYANTDSLKKSWFAFGYATLDYALVVDTVGTPPDPAPIGHRYFKYIYNGATSTWGGAFENRDLADAPLDLSSAQGGIQFYLKGDGTDNVMYMRLYNGDVRWHSNFFSLKDSTWHIVRIPFAVDSSNGFILGAGAVPQTLEQLKSDIANVTNVRFYVVPEKVDITYKIYVDAIYAVDYIPTTEGLLIEDFEIYPDTDSLKVSWQGFGYFTVDYILNTEPLNAPEGYKYFTYVCKGTDQVTWGGAIKPRGWDTNPRDITIEADNPVIAFWLRGDGSDNRMYVRISKDPDMWGSIDVPLQDTTWHYVTIPLIADSLKGFRWLGDTYNEEVWGPDVGTTEQLRGHLESVTDLRWLWRYPAIDNVTLRPAIDDIRIIERPLLPTVVVDDFESYTDTDDLKTSWNQFGAGTVGLELTTDDIPSGLQAMKVSYNGNNGYTAVRKRNIIPGLNFADLSGGIQFWLKGDGSNNNITFRLQNGDEMWGSNKISLTDTEWQQIAINFAADSISGFRYLGNDPNNPIWSTDIGTTAQLYGDIASIDQVRFYIRNPEQIDVTYSVIIDNIEGVDEFDPGVIITAIDGNITNVFPTKFELKQNYPNPFNPTTTIEYTLPQSGLVTIKVFNILGQNVETLINRHQTSGTYRVQFDAKNLSSGVYFYMLEVQTNSVKSFKQVQKMAVIK
ncbi:T9SS type A sorting domain-containing protein [bacterium]|nr:T9SS type A sorting domain-containing protein [bacterium]